jgi:hypothetical protein
MMHLLCKFLSKILKMETGTKELDNDFLLGPLTFSIQQNPPFVEESDAIN